jgi:hypothetical protein
MLATSQPSQSSPLAGDASDQAPAAWADKFALKVWLACCLLLWAIAASNWLASLWRG